MDDIYSKKPWMKFYDPHVPEHLTYDDKSYARLFSETAQRLPKRTAVKYMGRSITFAELDALSNRFARFLVDQGLKTGDTVGVNLPNIPAYYIAIVGIMKAGCVLSGVSPLLSAKELEYQLNDSGSKVLVTLDLLFPKAAEVVAKTPVKTVLVAGIADFLPPVKKFLGTLLKKIPTGPVDPIEGVMVSRFLDAIPGTDCRSCRAGRARRCPGPDAVYRRHDRTAQGGPAHPCQPRAAHRPDQGVDGPRNRT